MDADSAVRTGPFVEASQPPLGFLTRQLRPALIERGLQRAKLRAGVRLRHISRMRTTPDTMTSRRSSCPGVHALRSFTPKSDERHETTPVSRCQGCAW